MNNLRTREPSTDRDQTAAEKFPLLGMRATALHAKLTAEDSPSADLTASEQKVLRDRFGMFNSLGNLPRPWLDKVFAILGLGPVDETER